MDVDDRSIDTTRETGGDYEGPLLRLADFMNTLGEHHGILMDVIEQGTVVQLTITELAYDLPLELRVRESMTGDLVLHSGPPTQRVETTIFPVLHRLKVRLALTEEVLG